MSVTTQSFDVVVVGLGPVGATVTALLGRYGIRVLAVDAELDIFPKPRAISLDSDALRILQLAGLENGSFPVTPIPVVKMHSPFVGEFARINVSGTKDGHHKLVTFHQPELEQALRSSLRALPSVEVALGTKLVKLVAEGSQVQVELTGQGGPNREVRARYLVAADGANSSVRSAVGLDFRGQSYQEDWLIVDARAVREPIDHVEFICDPARPVPHMVAPGGRQRWEFMLAPGETREEMERPEKVKELLAPWGRPEDMEIERTAVYRFNARVANRFRNGRVFLVGDAAHVTPPFAGQGLVSGLRDAANLSWKLAWALKQPAAPEVLGSYDQERRPHAKSMVRLATQLGHLIMPRSPMRARVTHSAVKRFRRTALGKQVFDEQRGKPEYRVKQGLVVSGSSGGPAQFGRGLVFPQELVTLRDGSTVLSDELLGPNFALVMMTPDGVTGLDPATERLLEKIGAKVVRVQQTPADDACVPASETDRSVFSRGIGARWAVVVRPDRIIMHDGPVGTVSQLAREALALLREPYAAAL